MLPSAPPFRAVFGATAAVALAGLIVELVYYTVGAPQGPVALLSLSYEANLPTWYATCLLFSCGLLLWTIGRRMRERGGHHPRHWRVLGGIFVYMSLDEAVELHEHLGGHFGTGGVLYFDWVIPASVVVLLVGAAYVPFLMALEPPTRRRFIVAGAVYVSGALLMELPLGYWTEREGVDNLGYALIDFVEETLELVGASLFLLALWARRSALMETEESP